MCTSENQLHKQSSFLLQPLWERDTREHRTRRRDKRDKGTGFEVGATTSLEEVWEMCEGGDAWNVCATDSAEVLAFDQEELENKEQHYQVTCLHLCACKLNCQKQTSEAFQPLRERETREQRRERRSGSFFWSEGGKGWEVGATDANQYSFCWFQEQFHTEKKTEQGH
mmetsp:Transcript_25722/g.40110  ORF Transcript_25722/g.40110 Transcript_25722/m.40110 type:complete len:168 (-) Transcript_25722:168-671(-)